MAQAAEAGPRSAIRLIIADDHPVVRDGLRAMLDEPGIDVVAEAGTGEEARRLTAELRPDLVLMDVRMPDMDGLTATAHIKREQPRVSVLLITSFDNVEYLRHAVAAGASGYLLKGMTRETLLGSINLIAEGGSIFDGELLREVLAGTLFDPDAARAVESLTERERTVTRHLSEGLTNREIAEQMGYSVGTIKNTVQTVMEKLQVSDRTQVAVMAVRAGLAS